MGNDLYKLVFYGKSSGNDFVIEKLNLIIMHKDELLQKKSDEIASLKKIIALLEQKILERVKNFFKN